MLSNSTIDYATRNDTPFLPAASMVQLLKKLHESHYHFTTVTPTTHERIMARQARPGASLRDIFGWNFPFAKASVQSEIFDLLDQANLMTHQHGLYRSKVRVASLGNDLFFHSAFPTHDGDAVFFGPDTYRFARFIRQSLHATLITQRVKKFINKRFRILDIGCGSGAGGITAARAIAGHGPMELVMNDINRTALAYTTINAEAADIDIILDSGDLYSTVAGKFDLIICNPPFLDDAAGRSYRDGGKQLGRALSLRIVKESLDRLTYGGQLVLYTGVAMVDDVDPFIADLQATFNAINCEWSYEEIDPDIFSEELDQPAYASAHRIAAVGLVVTRY